jgi:hypothetical protein
MGAVFGKYRKEIEDYSLALKISIATNLLLLIVSLVFVFFSIKIYQDKAVYVTIPPQIPGNTNLMLGTNSASIKTIEIFSQYFVNLFASYSPSKAEDGFRAIFHYVDKSIEHDERLRMFKMIKHIRLNNISQDFKLEKVVVNRSGSRYIATAKGQLTRKIGTIVELKSMGYAYEFTIAIRNGSPFFVKPIKSYFLATGKGDSSRLERYKQYNKYIDHR